MIQGRVGNRQWAILRGLADVFPEAITAAEAWRKTGLPTFGNGSMETVRRLIGQGLMDHACPENHACPAPPAPVRATCLVKITETGLDAKIGPGYAGRLPRSPAAATR